MSKPLVLRLCPCLDLSNIEYYRTISGERRVDEWCLSASTDSVDGAASNADELPGIANELIEISGSSALNMKAVAVGIVRLLALRGPSKRR